MFSRAVLFYLFATFSTSAYSLPSLRDIFLKVVPVQPLTCWSVVSSLPKDATPQQVEVIRELELQKFARAQAEEIAFLETAAQGLKIDGGRFSLEYNYKLIRTLDLLNDLISTRDLNMASDATDLVRTEFNEIRRAYFDYQLTSWRTYKIGFLYQQGLVPESYAEREIYRLAELRDQAVTNIGYNYVLYTSVLNLLEKVIKTDKVERREVIGLETVRTVSVEQPSETTYADMARRIRKNLMSPLNLGEIFSDVLSTPVADLENPPPEYKELASLLLAIFHARTRSVEDVILDNPADIRNLPSAKDVQEIFRAEPRARRAFLQSRMDAEKQAHKRMALTSYVVVGILRPIIESKFVPDALKSFLKDMIQVSYDQDVYDTIKPLIVVVLNSKDKDEKLFRLIFDMNAMTKNDKLLVSLYRAARNPDPNGENPRDIFFAIKQYARAQALTRKGDEAFNDYTEAVRRMEEAQKQGVLLGDWSMIRNNSSPLLRRQVILAGTGAGLTAAGIAAYQYQGQLAKLWQMIGLQ